MLSEFFLNCPHYFYFKAIKWSFMWQNITNLSYQLSFMSLWGEFPELSIINFKLLIFTTVRYHCSHGHELSHFSLL